MTNTKKIFAITTSVLLLFLSHNVWGQEKKKFWISGAARAIMYGDDYKNNIQPDSVTAKKTQGGHALVDLGINIQPSDQLLIQGMVRVRNDYGGFWGSGVTFDVRQLYLKGILGGFLKYQLGDINYKLTDYTFNNETGLINKFPGLITGPSLEQVKYDVFYTDQNVWRQQGGALDFALEFDKVIKEAGFDLYTSRVKPTNFDTQDDRLYSGGSVVITQSKHLKLGGQFANLYDLKGTSNNNIYFSNPVYTASAEVNYTIKKIKLLVASEFGKSTMKWENSTDAPELKDYFYDFSLKAISKKTGIDATLSYRNVGANYRSAGAQTLQINYLAAPAAYQRYGNEQKLRSISMLDLYRDASLYQTQIVGGLMAYDPRYDNATPYGRATPNRKGFNTEVNYEDPKKRWQLTANADILADVIGTGTTALKSYNTMGLYGKIQLHHWLKWKTRKLWVSGRIGNQQTSRSGAESFESIDLNSQFSNLNFLVTIYGPLNFLAEYRNWQTKGNEQLSERNEYSQIIDYSEYDINYNEHIMGAGLQYIFSEKNKIQFMYQNFKWQDDLGKTESYTIDNWTLLFTMKF